MNEFNEQIDNSIQRIISWFKTTYNDPTGFPCYDIDGKTGVKLSDRNLLCELDDYAPFFWILDEKSYIEDQCHRIARLVKKGKLLFNRPQIRRHKGLGLPGFFRNIRYADSQDYVEILYGLLELYELSGDKKFFETAEDLFSIILKHFNRHGFMRSFKLMPAGPVFSVSDAMAGMYIEIALDMARLTSDQAKADMWAGLADEWLRGWLNTEMFTKYGIFPSVYLTWPWNNVPGLKKKALLSELAKPNASMGYGLMALASPPFNSQYARNAFDKWIAGLYQHYSTPQCVLTQFPRLSAFDQFGPVLSTNFAILDILCDAVYQFKCKDCLDLAVSISQFFLKYQSTITGLIPDEPGKDRSYLDANTDFAVSLAKVAEITGDDKYRQAGQTVLSGIMKYHSGEFGYFRDVDLNTGEAISNLVETRFCSLLLKPLVLYRDNIPIYGDEGRWSLFRDR